MTRPAKDARSRTRGIYPVSRVTAAPRVRRRLEGKAVVVSTGGGRVSGNLHKADAVIVAADEYAALLQRIEDAEDARAAREIMARTKPENFLSADEVERMVLDGTSPVRVWRQHRRIMVKDLAAAAGISATYLTEIERGHKPGSARALKALAEVLDVDAASLVRD